MKRKMMIALTSMLIISGCTMKESQRDVDTIPFMFNEDEQNYPMMHNKGMQNRHMSHDSIVRLNDSTGENELAIPPALERNDVEGITYTITAQQGQTEIFDGVKTITSGYNGAFLGPMLRFREGEKVTMKLVNELDEQTTFHWHGLEVAADADGGPHDVIAAGEEKNIEFEVAQEAATLWFHPHPEGKTAEQVYNGLAGLIYIEDDNSERLNLPTDYGKNDVPLIFQDRYFDENKQLNYRAAKNEDGTVGNTMLINGTVNPQLTVQQEQVRLRLLNGSNARNMTFKLSTGDSFVQIATDGGFLNEPIRLNEITLTPSERAEIIVDFSKLTQTNHVALLDDEESIVLPFHISKETGEEYEVSDTLNNISLTAAEEELPVTKNIELFGMMDMVTINGRKFDPKRIDFTQQQGVTEVWEIYNKKDMMGGMIHPFHIHGTQFKIVSRDGRPPTANEQGWKDSIAVHPGERVKIAVRFDHKGIYMFHCHVLEHEDNGMMGQVEVK